MLEHDVASAAHFTLADVRASLDPLAIGRGEAYARDGRVSGIKLTNAGHSIAAQVRGSRSAPYRVAVYITRARSGRTLISGSCECPLSIDCKHIAATLIAILQARSDAVSAAARGRAERDEFHAPTASTGSTAASRRTATETDAAVDRWLTGIRDSVSTGRGEPNVDEERIAYLFTGKSTAAYARHAFPIEMVVVRRTKAARWTKLRTVAVDALVAATARAVGTNDALIGRFMQAHERSSGASGALVDELTRAIIATGHAHLARLDSPPLTLGPVREARISWTLSTDGTQRPSLDFDDPLVNQLPGVPTWYVHAASGLAGPVTTGLPAATVAALLAAPALDPTQAKRVRERLALPLADFAIPPPLEITERSVHVKPIPMLKLQSLELPAPPSPRGSIELPAEIIDVAQFWFAYGDVSVEPESPGTDVRRLSGTESLSYARSLAAERKALKRVAKLGFLHDDETEERAGLRGAMLLRFPDELERYWPIFVHRDVDELRTEGWQIEIDPAFRHRVVDLADDDVWQTSIEDRSDGWFDVGIGLDVGGQRVDLLAILSSLLQRSDALGDPAVLERLGPDDFYYIRLADANTSLAFPAVRLKSIIATLVELYDPDSLRAGGVLRLPGVRAGTINELAIASGLRWDVPERLAKLGERLRAFSGVTRVAVPAAFCGELRPYQRDGLDWLQFLAEYGFGGILADDMGLGKSVQTLAHLLAQKAAGRLTEPALLVVPTSLVHNWRDEAARFAPTLRVLALHGPARADHFAEIAVHDVVITTYALLTRDTLLHERTWHAVILDEAQALKNPQAKVAQIAMGLRAEHRLCLTGTPVENHLGDLWSLFSIALPGALGDRKQFGRIFRTPIEKQGNTARNAALAQRIAPFLLRRTKEAVASELPEKTEIVQRVELVGAQRDLYEAVRLAMHRRVRTEIEQRGLARSQIIILDALLKLRQVCCDPRLLPKPMQRSADSVKLDHLLQLLPPMIEEGRRILIFSQFTSMLDLIARALDARAIPFVVLTGKTKDRASVVKRFQSGDVPVFLISLKAGGTGLNLTAADTVIHYDPWWNPAVERQATDRAHRIGQRKHVFVYKLIGAGTVEEKIVDLQARKAKLAAAIFSEKGGANARFAAEDVERLFAPLDADGDR